MILDNISYISAIEEILNDFSNLDIPAGKEINYITILEKRISSDLKLLKDEKTIDKATYKNIKPVGSRPSLMRFRKSAQGDAYLQTSKIFNTIFDAFNSK